MRKEWTRRLWWLLIINVPTFLIPVSITATTATTDTLEKCLLTSASSSSPSPSLSLSLSLSFSLSFFIFFCLLILSLFSLLSFPFPRPSLIVGWQLATNERNEAPISNQINNNNKKKEKRERERKRETKRKKPRLTTKETTANRCLGSFQFQLIKVVL